ncbi:dihydrolipoamide acetyltransferase family protein [Limnoglobus roseus]|uniref:Dihydrolipoamide acetyltransferase component of pyruvate dehydrogenase complex n=1 Tax=Limnoglobus roseus TaxID=2598579 RepID=A0A5C1A5E5_9BACT|nr:dihydrolipoamide acetyltransferase family protein [Limnoglobus roseus]QEL14359.1 2-oxo acid dehydrogenase subunit E2 [Limnoglobus roseus]
MTDFPLPPMGEGLYEVDLVRWMVKPGEAVHRGQGLMEVLSDKATMEVPSPFAGTIAETLAAAGTKIKVGEVVLKYDSGGGPSSPDVPPPPAEVRLQPPTPAAKTTTPVAAPSVRHLARKFNIDLSRVRGSGPGGRILLDDLAPLLKPPTAPANGEPKTAEHFQFDFGRAGTRVKLAGMRKKIAEKMVASKRYIPHYSYIDECDFTEVVHLRQQLAEHFYKSNLKLTYLAFIVKAVTRALKEVPIVNATFDEEAAEVTLHDRYHVGIAVAAPHGLLVPVIKDADRRDLPGIAREIERLSDDARAGRPKIDDLRGGTFTITSIGSIGGLISTPIINHPEVGILGIGKVVKRPVYDDHGTLHPRDIGYLSFSFDHRIVDGAIGAVFGNAVKRHLEKPAVLLVGG